MRLLFSALLALGFAAPALALSAPEKYDIRVPEMHCESCSQALTATFAKRPEVAVAEADIPSRRVTLILKPGRHLSEAEMRHLVEASGFKAGEIEQR